MGTHMIPESFAEESFDQHGEEAIIINESHTDSKVSEVNSENNDDSNSHCECGEKKVEDFEKREKEGTAFDSGDDEEKNTTEEDKNGSEKNEKRYLEEETEVHINIEINLNK